MLPILLVGIYSPRIGKNFVFRLIRGKHTASLSRRSLIYFARQRTNDHRFYFGGCVALRGVIGTMRAHTSRSLLLSVSPVDRRNQTERRGTRNDARDKSNARKRTQSEEAYLGRRIEIDRYSGNSREQEHADRRQHLRRDLIAESIVYHSVTA